MLEVQNHLVKAMDKNLATCIYSVDMSAAFDLLRPDKFDDLLKDNLDPGLLWTLLDFLQDRKFIVRYDSADSEVRSLDRGCVQGSVLGPALFSAYCRNLDETLANATVTSYADDTYVILTAQTMDELVEKTTETMRSHFEYLSFLGMVVNKTKTEVMFMKSRSEIPTQIMVEGEPLKTQKQLKVLGVLFDYDMSWTSHVSTLTIKAQRMATGMKILRRTLNQDEILKVITSQYFGCLFYAMAVWFPSLTVKLKKKIEMLHYKALRIVIKDWQRIYPKEMLDLLGRQKPDVFAKYMIGSIFINCYNTSKPTRLHQMIKENEYRIKRTGKIRYFDSSMKKVGQQALGNRLDEVVNLFNDDWTKLMTKDAIRVYLKKTFFL